MITILTSLIDELSTEVATTKKFLSIIPEDKYGWKPHPKSMSLGILAVHIAEIAGWPAMGFNTVEMDFEKTPYRPTLFKNDEDLIKILDKGFGYSIAALNNAGEKKLEEPWQLKYGGKILLDTTKYGLARHALSQMIHHRAQLGVYLRLLDIPIPGSYGPSADEK